MSTSWFSIGVRFLSGDMARGMRQAGQNFHGMIEGQKRDLDSLGAKLRTLESQEREAAKNLKESKKSYDDRVNAAKRAVTANRTEVQALNNELKTLGRSPAWETWNQQVKATGREIRKLQAQLGAVDAVRKKERGEAEVYHRAEINRLRELEQVAKRNFETERRRRIDLQAVAPRGAARLDPQHRERGLALQDERDAAVAAAAAARAKVRAAKAELRQLGVAQADLTRLDTRRNQVVLARTRRQLRQVLASGADEMEVPGMQRRAIVTRQMADIRESARTPEDKRQAINELMKRRGRARFVDVKDLRGDIDSQRRALEDRAVSLLSQKAGLGIVGRGVDDSPDVARQRAQIVAQAKALVGELTGLQREVDTQATAAVTARRKIRRLGRAAPSQAAIDSDTDIAGARVSEVGMRNLAREATDAVQRREQALTNAQQAASVKAADAAQALRGQLVMASEKRAGLLASEPQQHGDQARAATIRGQITQLLQQRLGAGGLFAQVAQAMNNPFGRANVAVDTSRLAQIRQDREAVQEEYRVKRQEYLASKAHVQELQGVRTQIKQNLWGAVYDLSSKFYLLANTVGRLRSMMASAAAFQFGSRGLSALLGGNRGEGADVYGAYARSARYQTEVSPTAAIARMRELAAAGYSRSEIPSATAGVYNTMLASQGEVSESGAFDLGISLDKAFGGNGQDMSSLLDTVVAASNKFPMTVGKIREALGYATEAAVQTGQSLEETLLGVGMIMPITKTASKAGTIFRNAALSLAKPKGQEILTNLGVSPKDLTGNNRPILDVFADMRRALQDVERQDMAGTWSPKYGKKLSKDEQAVARREAVSRLNMKKEELEFALTGQRGGAIFAALERLPQLAKSSLRGGIYEGNQFKFKDVDDALKAMRLGLLDTAGESRRMADELRKTSQMLGVSFTVSVEKFKISLGTFLLPVRDAFTNVAKTIVDGMTSWMNGGTDQNYGQPGGRPVGSSLGMNLLGSGVMFATVVMGVKTLATVFRTLGTARLLFQPKAIEATLAALKGGMGLPEAMREGSLVMANSAGGFASKVGMLASKVAGFLGPFALVAGAALAIKTAFDASRNAIVDYTHVTEAATVRRSSKFFGGLQAAFSGIAEGKIFQDPKTGQIQVPEELRKAILGGDRFSGGVMKGLLQGRDPMQVLEEARAQRVGEITKQYARAPEDVRRAKLQEFDEEYQRRKDEFFGMASEDILRRRRSEFEQQGLSPDDPRMISLKGMEMDALRSRTRQEAGYGEQYGMEMGGRDKSLLRQLMIDTRTTSVRDAIAASDESTFAKFSADITAEKFAKQNPDAGFFKSALGFGASIGSYVAGAVLRKGGGGSLMLGNEDLGVKMSDYDQGGRYTKGMPDALVQNPSPVWEKIAQGTDEQMRSNTWLEMISKELSRLPNALANAISSAAPANTGASSGGDGLFGQFFNLPTRAVP